MYYFGSGPRVIHSDMKHVHCDSDQMRSQHLCKTYCCKGLLKKHIKGMVYKDDNSAACHSGVTVTSPAIVMNRSWTCTPNRKLVLLSNRLQGKRFLNLIPVCDPGYQGMRWPARKEWHQIMPIMVAIIMCDYAFQLMISSRACQIDCISVLSDVATMQSKHPCTH